PPIVSHRLIGNDREAQEVAIELPRFLLIGDIHHGGANVSDHATTLPGPPPATSVRPVSGGTRENPELLQGDPRWAPTRAAPRFEVPALGGLGRRSSAWGGARCVHPHAR